MNGRWHLYRAGERWRRPSSDARIVIETASFSAVGFNIVDASFHTTRTLRRDSAVGAPSLEQSGMGLRCARALEDQQPVVSAA